MPDHQSERRHPTRDELAEAMQSAWEDFVGDTGCWPDCLTLHSGPMLSANFGVGNFAEMVASWLPGIMGTDTPTGTDDASHNGGPDV